MDDRTFDSLAKSFARGANRRSLLKGLLGLGGAAITVETLRDDGSAAPRPTPTPKPLKCPGQQIPSGGQCICPGALQKCGPDCCNSTIPWHAPGYSECCDNACCFGVCTAEETCCPAQFACPGGSGSADLCCASGTFCCGGGTDGNVCLPSGMPGTCCGGAALDPRTQICCNDVIITGNCCDVSDCNDDEVCCGGTCLYQTDHNDCCGGTTPYNPQEGLACCNDVVIEAECCPGETCANDGDCCDGQCCNDDEICCGVVCVYITDHNNCCGGDTPYNPQEQACCDGMVIEAECCPGGRCSNDGPCCAGVCCNDDEICCGVECLYITDHNNCCGGDTPYNPQEQACCGGVVVDAACCPGLDCGNGGPCCNGECCNDDEICCGTECLYITDHNNCCGGTTPYNPQEQSCCGGVVVDGEC